MNRRTFLNAAAKSIGAASLGGCSLGPNEYDLAIAKTWGKARGVKFPLMRELIHYATLAPSSHNTQCWKFEIQKSSIFITADFNRRCPAVDPDNHHLFVTLGCALENLALAAGANGLSADTHFNSAESRIGIHLSAAMKKETELFQAITERQSTRGKFDGKPLKNEELRILEKAGTGN